MTDLESTIKDLTLTKTLGLIPLKRTIYTQEQMNYLITELGRLATARQEVISKEVILEWIETFMDMNISFNMIIAKIRMCKASKRFGTQTTLGDIIECETINGELYHHYYKKDDTEQH